MVLDKKTALYARNDNGEFIPEEVLLEIDKEDELLKSLEGEKIFITPLSRGEIKTIFSEVGMRKDESRDLDGEIIQKHCFQPSFTEEDIKAMKPYIATAIINTIFRESGLQVPKKGDKKKVIQEAEDDFAKNS